MADAGTKAPGGGLRNVVAGQSALSTIDGAKGILSYRGIDIHPLAEQASFEEVVFLLHRGTLPTKSQLDAFRRELASQRALPDAALSVLHALPRTAHPMTALRTMISALGALDPDANDDGEAARERKALRLVAQTATVVATIERVRNGWAPVTPDLTLPHAANFLYMLRGQRPSDSEARIMDVALVLHADHEFNASTFVARVTASTLADIHGAVVAAISALKGPLHGGANEAVMQTLSEIKSIDRVESYLKDAFAAKRKIMGFGHAVYKTEDPRATHLRKLSRTLGDEKGRAALVRPVGEDRGVREAREGALRERGLLLGLALPRAGPAHRPVHAGVRRVARLRLDRARAGADREQQAYPARERVRRAQQRAVRAGRCPGLGGGFP